MAAPEPEEPAAPETAPTSDAGADAGMPADPSTGAGTPRRLRVFLSQGRLAGRAHRVALGVALALGLVVLAGESGASPGSGLPSPSPALSPPAPIAAASASPTAGPTQGPTSTAGSTPDASPSSASPDPRQSPLSAILKPRPGLLVAHGDITRSDVYISIDDCRNWANVEKDLQVANAAGIQVTLFPAGRYIDADKVAASRVLTEAVAYGDEIGNHTYTHSRLDSGSMTDIKADLDAQLAVVRTALNDKTYKEWFVRPPYGSGLGYQPFVTAAVKDGLSIAMWSIDSKGYQNGSTVEFVLQNVFDPKHFKNGAIIVMHDDATDTAALPLIIDGIRARGFTVGGVMKNILAARAPIATSLGLPVGRAFVPDSVARAESPLWRLGLRRFD